MRKRFAALLLMAIGMLLSIPIHIGIRPHIDNPLLFAIVVAIPAILLEMRAQPLYPLALKDWLGPEYRVFPFISLGLAIGILLLGRISFA